MDGFKAALNNELYKISKRKKIMMAAILSLIAVTIGVVGIWGINTQLGLRVAGSMEFSILILSVLSYTLIPVFSAFIAIDMFGGEFSANTMKLTLTRPATRFQVYLAKVCAAGIFILANLLFIMLLSIVLGLFISGMSGEIFRVMIAYIVAFLPLFVFTLFAVMLSNIMKGSLSAFMVSILVFIGFNVLGFLFSKYQSFFITSMFDWHTLFLSNYVNLQKIIREFIIMISCGIMFFTIGFILFDKREV